MMMDLTEMWNVASDPELTTVLLNSGHLIIICSGLFLLARQLRIFVQLFFLAATSIAVAVIGPSAFDGIPVYILIGLGILIGLNLFLWFLGLFIGRGT